MISTLELRPDNGTQLNVEAPNKCLLRLPTGRSYVGTALYILRSALHQQVSPIGTVLLDALGNLADDSRALLKLDLGTDISFLHTPERVLAGSVSYILTQAEYYLKHIYCDYYNEELKVVSGRASASYIVATFPGGNAQVFQKKEEWVPIYMGTIEEVEWRLLKK